MPRLLKCPYCGNETLGIIPANNGRTWGLVEFKKDSDPVALEGVLHVEVYACLYCKSISLKSSQIEKLNPN